MQEVAEGIAVFGNSAFLPLLGGEFCLNTLSCDPSDGVKSLVPAATRHSQSDVEGTHPCPREEVGFFFIQKAKAILESGNNP